MEAQINIIRCLSCGVKNRIPQGRFAVRSICGKCHTPLDAIIIRCLKCGVKNRLAEEKLRQKARCGKCGYSLMVTGSPGQVFMVDDQNFSREVLSVSGTVLVDCWAPWCGPCKMLAPILDELAAKYVGGIKITKLNVDENPFIAHKYDIKAVPTLLFIKEGNLVGSLSGLRAKEEIEGQILTLIKPS